MGFKNKKVENNNVKNDKKDKTKLFSKSKKKDVVEEISIEEKVAKRDITTFEKNNRNLKDLIANDYVDFSKDYKHGQVGEQYVKNMYLGITPASVDFPVFLDDLYCFGDIDTSLYIRPIDSEEAKAELTKLRTNLEVEVDTAGGSVNRRDDMMAKVAEAKRLRDEVRDGTNKIYEASVLSTLYAKELRDLENISSKLRTSLGRKDVGIKSATGIQEDAYCSNKPLMNNKVDEYHMFDKRSLACTFPFTSSNINHIDGIPIGRNMDTLSPIMYDTFDHNLDNYNMVVFAKSGGGKSTFIKMLAGRSATLDNISNIFIDIEPEYRDICEALGGVNIDISQSSNTIINFFDVTTELEENKLTGKKIEVVNVSEKINSVTAIILTMAKGFTGSNDKYYNDISRTIIKDCISACYRDIGITEDPESLYEYVDNKLVGDKIVGGKVKKEMPTLSSWYLKLKELSKQNTNDTYVMYYDYLLMVMKEYCKVTNGGFTSFDGQSTVELSYDIPFINFDVSKLNENTELPLAQHIICDYIWETLVKKNDKGAKLRVGIDEAWRMAKIVNGEPKFPEALAFLDTMFRRARKKNTQTVIISQQFQEFYNDLTQSIIKNADTKVFLPPDKTSLEDIQKVFHLTQGETNFLRNTKRGEALFKCGSASAKLLIEIPDFELAFAQTNQNAKRVQ